MTRACLHVSYLEEPISSVKGIIISMKDLKISTLSSLQTTSLTTLGSCTRNKTSRKTVCKKPRVGALCIQTPAKSKDHGLPGRGSREKLRCQQWARFLHSSNESLWCVLVWPTPAFSMWPQEPDLALFLLITVFPAWRGVWHLVGSQIHVRRRRRQRMAEKKGGGYG